MIGDEHDIAGIKFGIEAAGGVGDDEGSSAQGLEYADGKSHKRHGVSLVVVHAPLHNHHVHALQAADQQAAGMAGHGGDGKARYFLVGKGNVNRHLVGEGPQSRAQHNGNLRPDAGPRLNIVHRGGDLLQLFTHRSFWKLVAEES